MTQRTWMITGVSSGFGYDLTRQLKGLAIHGTRVNDAKKDIANWLDKANVSLG